MLWHEVVCNKCSRSCEGLSSCGNVNAKIKNIARSYGWYIGKKGYALCPECRKKMNEDSCKVEEE